MILTAIKAIPAFTKRVPWQAWAAIALVLVVTLHLRQDAKDEKAAYARGVAAEHALRMADRKAYQDAQAKAAADMRAENAAIEADQRRISDEAQSRYERDLARLRSNGVRKDLAAAPGPSSKGGATSVPEASCRADGQNVLVDRAIILRAAEIELGRNALIDWVNEQEAAWDKR